MDLRRSFHWRYFCFRIAKTIQSTVQLHRWFLVASNCQHWRLKRIGFHEGVTSANQCVLSTQTSTKFGFSTKSGYWSWWILQIKKETCLWTNCFNKEVYFHVSVNISPDDSSDLKTILQIRFVPIYDYQIASRTQVCHGPFGYRQHWTKSVCFQYFLNGKKKHYIYSINHTIHVYRNYPSLSYIPQKELE